MKKTKNIIIIAVFALLVLGLGLAELLLPDGLLSYSERRKLAQAPEISSDTVFSGDFSDDLESYLLDQFPLRDGFRTVKAWLKFYVFRQSDNNGVYLAENGAQKLDYPLDEKQLLYGLGKINAVYDKYLSGMNVFYSIIPDKNYFAAEKNGYPHMDYERLVSLANENLQGMSYIDIFPSLSLEDYYKTDAHWSQESIFAVRGKLADALGVSEALTSEAEYERRELYPFYGVYAGQSALPIGADTLVYLTSSATESAVVTSLEFEGERPVYSTALFSGMDGYDVFLSGAQALVTIDCPDAKTERELIVFRDSYASSLAPLFCGAFSKITLVDLRYISPEFLGSYIDFTDQDVLFLYSTSLLNGAGVLR